MKPLIFLLVATFSVTKSDKTSTISNDLAGKMVNSINTIPTIQKQEIYPTYQPIQAQPQYIPIQLIQKPVYLPQPQPQAAMIILAQPALVPHQMLYGGGVQHLLNYFHGNPHARYQLLNGYQPQPTAQTLLPQNPTTSATIGNYQFVSPPPQNQLIQSQINPQQQQQQQQQSYNQIQIQPPQLSAISNLAHLHAQQYTQQFTPQFSAPIRSIPPIITGLENFTPEQQAQIKAQLNSHLGGGGSSTSFNTVAANTIAPTGQPGAVIPTPQSTTILTTTQGQHSTLATPQGHVTGLGQISPKYSSQIQQQQQQQQQQTTSNEYLPEKDDKNIPTASDSSTIYTPAMNYRGQYTKG